MTALKASAFLIYLLTCLFLGMAGVAGVWLRRGRRTTTVVTVPIIVGTLLQATAALPITLSLGSGPLNPGTSELWGTIAFSLVAALLFGWSLWSAQHAQPDRLVITGAYAWLRHPMYAAFLAMLIATGLVVSAGLRLPAALLLYLAGTELRLSLEEAELEAKFPGEYRRYRLQTPWRYIPFLR